MARVKAPLMSIDASGSVAKAITFSKWKGRNYVRKLVKPAQPRTGLQVGMRSSLKFMAQGYKNLGATAQANWKTLAKPRAITNLNAEVRFNQPRIRQNFGPLKDPTIAPVAAEAAPTAPAATAQPKSVKVTWVDSVGANDYCTFLYMSTTTGFTPDVSNLIAVIAHGVLSFTKAKLLTGTPYYFVLKGCGTDGTLSAATAQVTATPT